jgi:uncharacterized protein YqjF (DUF2071 family)
MLLTHTEHGHQHAAFRAALIADWTDAVFIHFAISPADLQPHVPFQLDTRDGVAYVSLVAFTQRRLRPAFGGRMAEVLSTPLARHEFLNMRTYVRGPGAEGRSERGIYFIAEWIPNRLAALVGPSLYGLPYRVGRLRYTHDLAAGRIRVNVAAPGGQVAFDGTLDGTLDGTTFRLAGDDTLDAFLVERYAAWTFRNGVARRFRIRHAPWPIARATVDVTRSDLLDGLCDGLLRQLDVTAAHVSPGAFDVGISLPQRCDRQPDYWQ